MPDKQTETVRINLKPQVRTAIESRIAKYLNPRNLEWEWDDAQKWERHAMNAVLDLKAAEAALAQQKTEYEQRRLREQKWFASEFKRIGVEYLVDENHEAEPEYLKNIRAEAAEARLHTVMAIQPEELAKKFHEFYERLAPSFGYETRKESAKPWEQVPENNRNLMTAVCSEVLAALLKEE